MKKHILLFFLLEVIILFLFFTKTVKALVITEGSSCTTQYGQAWDCRPATAGSCDSNACVGIPLTCNPATWKWESINNNGQCTTECSNCSHTSSPSPSPSASNDWYGCATYVSDNCPDKSKTCTTSDGKAGVECNITCTACGSKANGQAYRSGACGGPRTDGPYCDPNGSGQMIGGTCTWKVCTPANTVTPGNCTISANLSSACTNCILGVKNQGEGDLLNTMKSLNHSLFDPCSAEAIVSYWCSNLSSGATTECNTIKSGTCVSACGSSASTSPSAPPSSSSPSAPPGSTAPSSAPSSAPSVTTTHYRIAENPTDLNTAVWQEYKTEPTLLDFEFKDKTPGLKSIWVDFKGSNNNTERRTAQIRLLGPDPKINSCSLSFEGNNTILNLKGENFGSGKGTVKSGNTTFTAEQIRLWKNDSVQAIWPNAPSGEALPVLLTNTDGQQGEGQCSAISQLSVGAKFFCGGPPPATVSNVDLVLAGVFEGGKVLRQKVSIDTTGVIQGLSQKLEEDKDYKLSLKAPRSLRKSASFTAGSGSTNVSNFTLPLGDIFPAKDADGKINTFDYGELVRQLIISRDASNRSADFNADSRVNSIDWACMRHDFNKEDDPEPVAGSLPSPSPSPNVSPSPGASVSPSPSPSPSSSPAP